MLMRRKKFLHLIYLMGLMGLLGLLGEMGVLISQNVGSL